MASLESEHLSTLGDRWLLPASHLIEFESPQDAARRIAREQLGLERPELDGPRVFSETYPSAIDPASGAHWDVHFVFEGKWPSQNRPAAPVWRELNLLDCERLSRNEIGRGHADVLALVGLRLRG